jgi:hypothetical protein
MEVRRSLATRILGLTLAMLTIGACSGAADTGTTPGSATTEGVGITTTTSVATTQTSVAATSTTAVASTGSTYPPECLEAVEGFIAEVEPIVAEFDFDGGDMNDYLDLLTAQVPALTTLTERYLQAQCEASSQLITPGMEEDLLAFAQAEAPGSMAFLEIMTSETPHRDADCEGFTGAMQSYVDQGGVFADLTPAQKLDVANLYASITNWCGLQTAGEYLSRPEVEGFLGITVG